jgi:uncharacterized protein YprB with RNaseH-like and TPR domain
MNNQDKRQALLEDAKEISRQYSRSHGPGTKERLEVEYRNIRYILCELDGIPWALPPISIYHLEVNAMPRAMTKEEARQALLEDVNEISRQYSRSRHRAEKETLGADYRKIEHVLEHMRRALYAEAMNIRRQYAQLSDRCEKKTLAARYRHIDRELTELGLLPPLTPPGELNSNSVVEMTREPIKNTRVKPELAKGTPEGPSYPCFAPNEPVGRTERDLGQAFFDAVVAKIKPNIVNPVVWAQNNCEYFDTCNTKPVIPQSPGAAKHTSNSETRKEDSARLLRERRELMARLGWPQRDVTDGDTCVQAKFEAQNVLDGQLVNGEGGQFLLLRSEYPLEYMHGNTRLCAAVESNSELLTFLGTDLDLFKRNPERTLFLDIETTGLHGAGTVAFLIGIGRFQDGSFVLDQFFMRDYDDEEPMLEYFSKVFSKYDTLVTFNGKTFDVPRLRARFIQNRLRCQLDDVKHIDLLYTARRLWKRRLPRCGLGNVEHSILGVQRSGDVPSAAIPEIWLEYVHTREQQPLQRVFYHHRMDVLSLVTFLGLLSQRLRLEDGCQFEHVEDQFSLMKEYSRRQQYDRVLMLGESFLKREGIDAFRQDCLDLMAMTSSRLRKKGS